MFPKSTLPLGRLKLAMRGLNSVSKCALSSDIKVKLCKETPESKLNNAPINAPTLDNPLGDFLEKHFKFKAENRAAYSLAPITQHSFYCKDSRGEEPNFGAPGGDFGEFLLALDTFVKRTGKPVDVDGVLGRWLDVACSKERPFYFHSDAAAISRAFPEAKGDLLDALKNLSEAERPAFLHLLSQDPLKNGCGHIRLILTDPLKYDLNPILLGQLTSAAFNRFWTGDPRVLLKIYGCGLDANALAIVYGPDSMDSSLLAIQNVGSEQVFILNHHAVRLYRRQALTPFFKSLAGEGFDEVGFFEEIEAKGWRNAGYSADVLAQGKPVYRIEVQGAGK